MDKRKKYLFERQPVRHTNLAADITPSERQSHTRTLIFNVRGKEHHVPIRRKMRHFTKPAK